MCVCVFIVHQYVLLLQCVCVCVCVCVCDFYKWCMYVLVKLVKHNFKLLCCNTVTEIYDNKVTLELDFGLLQDIMRPKLTWSLLWLCPPQVIKPVLFVF